MEVWKGKGTVLCSHADLVMLVLKIRFQRRLKVGKNMCELSGHFNSLCLIDFSIEERKLIKLFSFHILLCFHYLKF